MNSMNISDWNQKYDVIVVGGGHAGVEAAYAAARMGSRTLMITLNLDRVGWMPCNPAIGGIGKGHIVFELSALGGLMPKLCTQTYLQARMLNTRKGPAVQGLRLQIDKLAYQQLCKQTLETTPNLTIISGMAEDLLVQEGKIIGVTTREGATFYSKAVILTTGTFLNGLLHTGPKSYPGGRQAEEPAVSLAASLHTLGLQMGRLKTGTPARLLRSSIDFSKMERQESDPLTSLFEFYPHTVQHKIDCYITATNEKTHDIIRKNFHLSPLFTGHITGTPPRYCPSIEDKISRFADKSSHHVFVEPESASSEEVYPNGISTSLPLEAQREFIQTIAGFERAVISRPGYAVEYDYVFPNQLHHSLELKQVPGLFLAGQINGTTGYEEAAGQGAIAGINAHLKVAGKEPFVVDRTQGYLGIMIDDLVTLGVDEPYRMFTSRAERRLLLRQDNTFSRFADDALRLGLIDQKLYDDIQWEKELGHAIVAKLSSPKSAYDELIRTLSEQGFEALRPAVLAAAEEIAAGKPFTDRVIATVHAELLYGPYMQREVREVEKAQEYKNLIIPAELDVQNLSGLSIELRQKLQKYRPATIAQAALIQGMTPAAISLLIFRAREIVERRR